MQMSLKMCYVVIHGRKNGLKAVTGLQRPGEPEQDPDSPSS